MTPSIMSDVTERLVSFWKYEISKSFRYDLDCGSLGLIMSFKLTLFNSFIYFSIMFRLEKATTC